MAWTTPRTWVTGELVTAVILNAYVRDNQNALDGGRMSITSQAAGDVFYATDGNTVARLAKDAGKYLQSGASAPSWVTISATTFASISPLTTRGDTIVATSGVVTGTRLAIGGANTFLGSDGTDATWTAVSTTVKMLAKTADYTISETESDIQVICDATSGAIAITLRAVSGLAGYVVKVKKIDSSTNTVTIDGNGSETIDGATTQVISARYTSLSVVCDGTTWHIF